MATYREQTVEIALGLKAPSKAAISALTLRIPNGGVVSAPVPAHPVQHTQECGSEDGRKTGNKDRRQATHRSENRDADQHPLPAQPVSGERDEKHRRSPTSQTGTDNASDLHRIEPDLGGEIPRRTPIIPVESASRNTVT